MFDKGPEYTFAQKNPKSTWLTGTQCQKNGGIDVIAVIYDNIFNFSFFT